MLKITNFSSISLRLNNMIIKLAGCVEKVRERERAEKKTIYTYNYYYKIEIKQNVTKGKAETTMGKFSRERLETLKGAKGSIIE